MVTGIIPLVPGGLAFDATKNLVLLQFGKAINTMLEVTLIAGAIALGLLFADQISKSSFLVSLDDVNVYNNKTREIVGNSPSSLAFTYIIFIFYHFFNFSF